MLSKMVGSIGALSLVLSLTGCPYGDPVTCDQENEQSVDVVQISGTASGDVDVTLANGNHVDLALPGTSVDAGDAGNGSCSAATFVPGNNASVYTTFEFSCALPDGTTATFSVVVPDTRSLEVGGAGSVGVDPGQTSASGEACVAKEASIPFSITQSTGGASGDTVTSDYEQTISITGSADTPQAWYEKPAGTIDLDDGGGQPTACAAAPAFSSVIVNLVLEQHASDFTAHQECH